MTRTILGLDIGGANLKAATPDGRAVSVPFALWKQPDRLAAALAELVGRFADAGELAVTMTGELCDCYETKRQGVNAILDAVEFAAAGRPVRVWGTGGEFLTTAASRAEYMTVAAANWHALATFAGRAEPDGLALLIDIGSTTTDLIRLINGVPKPSGLDDAVRLSTGELLYTGVRRTPVCSLVSHKVTAELFATTLDVYLTSGELTGSSHDCDTADGRPATQTYAYARLARMLGGDSQTISPASVNQLVSRVREAQIQKITRSVEIVTKRWVAEFTVITSGAGEFLCDQVLNHPGYNTLYRVSLSTGLGDTISACAPAYAVAVLASERPL